MSRYINADDALELLNLMYDNQADRDDPYNVGVMGAINYIKHKAPSIDVVRCGECKYQNKGGNEREAWNLCAYRPWLYKPTSDESFCSYGERRSDE